MSSGVARNIKQPPPLPPAPPTATPTLLRRCCALLAGISFRTHLLVSILLRVALIAYSQLHDEHSELPYTDIDYKVVTDGARQILAGRSPFERHTFRYSPVLAYLQLPNIWLHPAAGKLLYASFDLFVGLLIYALVRAELRAQCRKAVQALLSKFGKPRRDVNKDASAAVDERRDGQPERVARASACFWLYNPLTAVISTRGNGDSFSSFFVILTIYLLARADDAQSRSRCDSTTGSRRLQRNFLVFAAGLAHGFAIHLRLYPVLFSLAYYLSLSERLTRNMPDFLRQLWRPSARQLLLVAGTAIGLLSVSGFFYRLYGWQYVYEAYLYHFVRKDVRHNFSLYFLMQYLSGATEAAVFEKLLIVAPQFVLLLYLSFAFGQFRQTLPFCVFALAFVAVSYNSVVTSQYFVWYLALLPLCLNNLQSLPLPAALGYFALWLVAQALWLLPAYLLEFRAWHTFYWLGAQGLLFFVVNNFVLARLIEHYSFTAFKVNFKKLL